MENSGGSLSVSCSPVAMAVAIDGNVVVRHSLISLTPEEGEERIWVSFGCLTVLRGYLWLKRQVPVEPLM